MSVKAQLVDEPRHVHGFPQHDSIGQETEAGRLIHDLFVGSGLKCPLFATKKRRAN